MRYLLFALALLAGISAVTVPTVTYADPGNRGQGWNGGPGGGEANGPPRDCGGRFVGDEC